MKTVRRMSTSSILRLVKGAEMIASVTGEKASDIVAWILGEEAIDEDEEAAEDERPEGGHEAA